MEKIASFFCGLFSNNNFCSELVHEVSRLSNDPELAATYKILVGRAIGSAFLDVRRVVARIIKSVRRGRRETKDGHQ